MSHTFEGEHTQQVWLTDRELGALILCLQYFCRGGDLLIRADQVDALISLLKRLEAEK